MANTTADYSEIMNYGKQSKPLSSQEIVKGAQVDMANDPDAQSWAKSGWEKQAIQEGTLSPDQQKGYEKWHSDNGVGNDHEYNMPAFYKKYVHGKSPEEVKKNTDYNPADKSMHYTDEFKTPNARTASKYSNYVDPTKGADWTYLNKQSGKWEHGIDEPTGDAMKNYKYAAAVLPNGKVIGLEDWDNKGTPEEGIKTFRGNEKLNLSDIGMNSSPSQKQDPYADIMNYGKVAEQPPLQAEQAQEGIPQRIQGFVSNTIKAVGDYAKNITEEAPKKGSADAMAAGALKGIGQFSMLPVELLTEVAAKMNKPALDEAIKEYPLLGKAIALGRGEVTNPQYNQLAQQFPASTGTGETLGPMGVPLYDFAKAGQLVAPLARLANHPIAREALQASIGSAPLAAANTALQYANAKRRNPNNNKAEANIIPELIAQMAVPGVLHGGAKKLFGNVEKNVKAELAPPEQGLSAAPAQQTLELPTKLRKAPIKQNNKSVDIKDPYEKAAYKYWKAPASKDGKTAKRWLDANYPGSDTQYKNDGALIEQGITVLAKDEESATLTLNKGEAQKAATSAKEKAENKQISKDRDKYEKDQEKQKKEAEKFEKERAAEQAKQDKEYATVIDKREKELQKAEDKANKLHADALEEADKFKKAELRKEEILAWKDYERQQKELEQANKDYDTFRADEEARAKKEKVKLEKEKAKEDKKKEQDKALNDIYGKEPLKGEVEEDDTRYDIRSERIAAARKKGKPAELNKFTRQEQGWLKNFADRKRAENYAEAKYKIALKAAAEAEGIELQEDFDIVPPSLKSASRKLRGVELKKLSPALQVTPFESAKIPDNVAGKIRKTVLKGDVESDNEIRKLRGQYEDRKAEYENYRKSKPENSHLSRAELIEKKLKENQYTEHAEANIWNKPEGYEATEGPDKVSRDNKKIHDQDMRDAEREGKLMKWRYTTEEQADILYTKLRGKLAKKVPKQIKDKITNTLNALKPSGNSKSPGAATFGVPLPGVPQVLKLLGYVGKTVNVEGAQAKLLTITEEDIFKRNNPELAQKLANLDGQDSLNSAGVPAPKTPQQKQAFYEALRPKADEDELEMGEGIYAVLDKKTRNYLHQARILREQKLELVNDALEKDFGTSEGDIEDVNTNMYNWQKDPKVRYFRALKVAQALNGGAPRESAFGKWGDRIAGNLMEVHLTGKQSMHVIHGLEAFFTNFSNDSPGTVKSIIQMGASPKLRKMLGLFDFGGPLKTRFVEHQENAHLEGGVKIDDKSDGIFKKMAEKLLTPEQWANFKDGVQGSYIEKNFKVSLTRTVALNQAAKDLKMPFDKLVELITQEAKGEKLTDSQMEKVLYAHTEMAQYLKETIGYSNPALRSGDFMDYFPLSSQMTVFISSRQRVAHLTNSYLPRAFELARAGKGWAAANKIRALLTWHALNIALNGAKGLGVGISIALALGLKQREKEMLDNALNRCAIFGNVFHYYMPDVQPQGSPIAMSLSPGFVGIAIEAFQTLHDGFYGLGPFGKTTKNAQVQQARNTTNYKRFMKASAESLALFGFSTFADGTMGTMVALDIAFRANDVMQGHKNEMHYSPLTKSHMKTEVNVPTNFLNEAINFTTKGESEAYMQVQNKLERETVAYTKIYWGACLNMPGYKKALEDGNAQARKADAEMIKEMNDLGLHHNSPAHAIGHYTEGGTSFSWARKLEGLEAPAPSDLMQQPETSGITKS